MRVSKKNIFLKKNEKRDYLMVEQSYNTNVYLSENSYLRFYTFNFGSKNAVNNLNVVFQGKNAKAELYGLYLPSEEYIIENNTFLNHKVPFCQSFQQYYGILFDQGRAVFNGKILVAKKSQKTDAYLESKNILWGEKTQMLGKPFLEIFADDVKCTHGFASFRIDENEIFYLQSRGIGRQEAEKILLFGFAKIIINKINSPKIKNNLCARISQFLSEKLEAKN